MKVNNSRYIRYFAVFSVSILLLVTMASVVYASNNENVKLRKNDNRVVIDLNYYDDIFSELDYYSKSGPRVVEMNDKFDQDDIGYRISNVFDDIEISPVEILTEKGMKNEGKYYFKSGDIKTKNNPLSDSKMELRSNNDYGILYENTVSGLKETIIINQYPRNITNDMIIRSELHFRPGNVDLGLIENNTITEYDYSKTNSSLLFIKRDRIIFTIQPPILEDTPDIMRSENGLLTIEETVNTIHLKHRIWMEKNRYYHEIIIPFEILDNPEIKYPIFIDPSISSFNGVVEYEGYSNGSVVMRDGNSETWYPNADRTVYVDSNITIGMNEVLRFKNIKLLMNQTGTEIKVDNMGRLDIMENSSVEKNENCDGYNIIYKSGSEGLITDSSISGINSTNGLEIKSSYVLVQSCELFNNMPCGLFINQSSPSIINTNIHNVEIGVVISPFSNPMMFGNDIYLTDVGIEWDSANIFDDFDDSFNIEQCAGTIIANGSIKYLNSTNIALTCPSVSVDSTYATSYSKERMYDGVTEQVWWNQWNSDSSSEPHWAIFDFGDLKNISGFKVQHREDHPTYDYLIQTWNGSSWSTQFNINDNTDAVTIHEMNNVVSTSKVRLYITDSNENFDSIARIREFEIYQDFGSPTHHVISKAFRIYGDSIFDTLKIETQTPGSSQVRISILDGGTNQTISGFNQLAIDTINLKTINVEDHSSIRIKAEFTKDGNNLPKLKKMKLIFCPMRSQRIDFNSEIDISESESLSISNGQLHLDWKTVIDEQWDENWDDNWTVVKQYDGGDDEVVSDHWTDSGNDLYIEGKSGSMSPGHDGCVRVYSYVEDIKKNHTLNAHFSGKIDDDVFNYADTMITLLDDTNSSFRRIHWTTRDYSYNGGLVENFSHWGMLGDVYYIVAHENDGSAPYEYDETISNTFLDLFEGYFGNGSINWSKYDNLEIRFQSIENYNIPDNPKVYVDYITIINTTVTSGHAFTHSFSRSVNTHWTYLLINRSIEYNSDFKYSLCYSTNSATIPGYVNRTEKYLDLSYLNEANIYSFCLKIDLFSSNKSNPMVDYIIAYQTSKIDMNIIRDSRIGIQLYDFSPYIFNNQILNNSLYGIYLVENQTSQKGEIINENSPVFQLSSNIINNNYIGIKTHNTSAVLYQNTFSDNQKSIDITNSSLLIDSTSFKDNNEIMYVNGSTLKLIDSSFSTSIFSIVSNNSNIEIETVSFINNHMNNITIENSNLIFIDTYYENISKEIDDQYSSIECKWRCDFDLIERNQDPLSNYQLQIFNNNGIEFGNGFSDMTGHISDLMITERKITSDDIIIYNPFKISIDSPRYPENISISILHHFDETLYPYNDCDDDDIPDSVEANESTHHFSAEDLVISSEQIENDLEFCVIRNQETVITDKFLTNITEGDYKLYILMRNESEEDVGITVSVYNKTGNLLSNTFIINDQLRFYSPPAFHSSGDVIGLNISLSSTSSINSTVYLYDVYLKDIGINDSNTIMNPLEDDLDYDGIIDGLEYNDDVYIHEAEELLFSSNQLNLDPDASNRTSLSRLSNGTLIAHGFPVINGTYGVYVKARSDGSSSDYFNISINSIPYSINVTSQWNWYEITNNASINTTLNILISSESDDVQVDKIIYYRDYHADNLSQYLSEMFDETNLIPTMPRPIFNERWEINTAEQLSSKPALFGNRVYYTTMDGDIVVLNRSSGEIIDKQSVLPSPNNSSINYCSTPVIDILSGVGICYFEKDIVSNFIVGFDIYDLSIKYSISYILFDSLKQTGILTSSDMFFYSLNSNPPKVIGRNITNGNLTWSHLIIAANSITRITLIESDGVIYAGTDTNELVKIINIFQTSICMVTTLNGQNPYNMKSVLLPYQDSLITVTYGGEVIQIYDDGIGSVNELYDGDSYITNTKMIIEKGILYYIGSGGTLDRLIIQNQSHNSYDTNICYNFFYIDSTRIYVGVSGWIEIIDKVTLEPIRTIYINKAETDIVFSNHEIHFAEKETGLVYCYGPMISDVIDTDLDSDGSKDGMELDGTFNKYLVEAEDYYSQVSTAYNVSAVTMYASEANQDIRFDIGYPDYLSGNPKNCSTMNYYIDIEESGVYSLLLITLPYVAVKPIYEGISSSQAFITYDKEYILSALQKALKVSINNSLLKSGGCWDYGLNVNSKQIDTEALGGSGCFFWEGIFYLEKGPHDMQVKLDIINPYTCNDPPLWTITSHNTDYEFWLMAMNATFDRYVFRVPNLSILDSDCDDDGFVDGDELLLNTFPLNSDPDMDGLSDYYEINGVSGDYTFNYDGTNPSSRDSDSDGVRDRVELGLNSTDLDQYTIYDTENSTASAFERHVRGSGSDLPGGSKISNGDADWQTQTDPRDADTDDDGLPDGVMDGLQYFPIYSGNSNDFGPSGSDRWKISGEKFNKIIEFWEGEDFDLDGMVDEDEINGWTIGNYRSTGTETSPVDFDSDDDGLPDGWEVWHVIDPTSNSLRNGPGGNAERIISDKSKHFPWYYCKSNYSDDNDGIMNYFEYLYGTNPAINDTDGDGKDDNEEIFNEGSEVLLMNTNIENASCSGANYGANSGQHIIYDYDLHGFNFDIWFGYSKTVLYDGYNYSLTYPNALQETNINNRLITSLYDGTRIVYNTSSYEIYVLKPFSLLKDINGDGFYDLECIYYDATTSFLINTSLRYSRIFVSDPLKVDTDGDGLTDLEEDWEDEFSSCKYHGDIDLDDIYNLRDFDSDDDGLMDSKEINYYFDKTYDDYGNLINSTRIYEPNIDGDLFPNVFDSDSDNDKIEDGYELNWNDTEYGFGDIDGDGYPSMLDIDSDGDGIPDGWIDGYVYDPSVEISRGGFYKEITPDMENNDQEPLEGEDIDWNKRINGDTNGNRIIDPGETFYETDPYYPDTDRDYLLDGYTTENIATQIHFKRYYNVLETGELSITLNGETCNATISDTDVDGIIDGKELKGWYVSITTLDEIPESWHVTSHPLKYDTDSDGYSDGYEYANLSDPNTEDTDRDNITDSDERLNGSNPFDQDTDNDGLADGYIDLNNNGIIEDGEGESYSLTNRLNPDSDSDGLLDGQETAYLAFRTNAEKIGSSYNYDSPGTWIFLDPGIGEYKVYWYNKTTNNTPNNYQRLPYDALGGNATYSLITKEENDTVSSLNSSYAKKVMIKKDSTHYVVYYEEEDFFDDKIRLCGGYSALRDFQNQYGQAFVVPHASYSYGDKEVIFIISDPNKYDTDGDTLSDGDEYYKMCWGSSLFFLNDTIDGDNKTPLFDKDSDNDYIHDSVDMMINTVNTSQYQGVNDGSWKQYYFGDYDGDGIPCALDTNSDGDNYSDKYEDETGSYDGYYDNGDRSNPLRFDIFDDNDFDGINNSVEEKYGLNPNDSDTDDDGILDGFDGPGGRWWMDIDKDGKISANDPDSDGDGLWDGEDIGENLGELSVHEGFGPTDPWNPDTDGDKLWDGFNVPNSSISYFRYYMFFNGKMNLNDFPVENGSFEWIGELEIGTDPLNPDCDNDTILDGWEMYGFSECGVMINNYHQINQFNKKAIDTITIPLTIPNEYYLAVVLTDNGNSGQWEMKSLSYKIEYPDNTTSEEYTFKTARYQKTTNYVYLGKYGNCTVVNLTVTDNDNRVSKEYYLLRNGMNPKLNDSDADFLLDNEEIFGVYDFYTHPLSDDSDSDNLKDYEEICYIPRDLGPAYTLNPLDYDYDNDDIPDGFDNDPVSAEKRPWTGVQPFVMRETVTVEYIYAVRGSHGAYSSERARDGAFDQSDGQYWAHKFFSNDSYAIQSFGQISNPYSIETKSYDYGRASIVYHIKGQTIDVTYANNDWYNFNDYYRHSDLILCFEPDKDYEVSMIVGIDENEYSEDLEYNLSLFGKTKIFNDFYYTENPDRNHHADTNVMFKSTYIYEDDADISAVGKTSPLYDGGYRLFEYRTYIPKEIINRGRTNVMNDEGEIIKNNSNVRYLGIDFGLRTVKYNESSSDVSNSGLITSGIYREISNNSYEMITTNNKINGRYLTALNVQKIIEDRNFNIFEKGTNMIVINDVYINNITFDLQVQIIDFTDGSDYEELNDTLGIYRNGKLENIHSLIIIAKNNRALKDILNEHEWPTTWDLNGNKKELDQYNNLTLNRMTMSTNHINVSRNLSLDLNVYSEEMTIKDMINIGKKSYKLYKNMKTLIDGKSYKANKFDLTAVKNGDSDSYSMTINSDVSSKNNVDHEDITTVKKCFVFRVNDIDSDNMVEFEETEEIKVSTEKRGGLKKLSNGISYIGSGIKIAKKSVTIYSDAKVLIGLISDKNDTLAIVMYSLKISCEVTEIGLEITEVILKFKNVELNIVYKNVLKIPILAAIGMAIELVLTIYMVYKLCQSMAETTNWIAYTAVAEEIGFTILDFVVSLCCFILICIPIPVFAIVAIAIQLVYMLLKKTGALYFMYELYYNNIIGLSSSQQKLDAYEKITSRISDLCEERQEKWIELGKLSPNKFEYPIVCMPVYPDASR